MRGVGAVLYVGSAVADVAAVYWCDVGAVVYVGGVGVLVRVSGSR